MANCEKLRLERSSCDPQTSEVGLERTKQALSDEVGEGGRIVRSSAKSGSLPGAQNKTLDVAERG